MNKDKLIQIAKKLSDPPKGILAADESTKTIKKRFESINLNSTFETRRKYREILFKTENLNKFISGIILYDETIRQTTSEGDLFPKYLIKNGISPGIKVDTGAISLSNSKEKVTEGIDGLEERLKEYKSLGAEFTKWRAIIQIGSSIPTDYCIELNSDLLGRYARIVQDNDLVPIVEPEILMDGEHSIEECYEVTKKTLKKFFEQSEKHNVFLKGMLLKPNMIISGKSCKKQASVEEVSKMTVNCLQETVPDDVPGIVFLSGGQSNQLATNHLNEMNKSFKKLPWNLSFSDGRALQQPSISSWMGKDKNTEVSQKALFLRSKLNSNATLGNYSGEQENLSR